MKTTQWTLPLLLCAAAAGLAAAPRTYVLEAGCYEKIVIDDGEKWTGVYAGENGSLVAREATLKVEKAKNPAEGTYPEIVTKVSTGPGSKTLFLVKGEGRPRPGPLKTFYRAKDASEDGNDSFRDRGQVEGDAEKGHWRVFLKSLKEPDGAQLDAVAITDGRRTEELSSCGHRDSVYPLWVGDLDGDGRADVLVKIEHHNYQMELELFLSAGAGKSMVRRVARFSGRKLD